MTRNELFKNALAECERFRQSYPVDEALVSITEQLRYLICIDEGKRDDLHRLQDIIIGVLTVREIEPLDGGLAAMLADVAEEARKMKRQFGLAVGPFD